MNSKLTPHSGSMQKEATKTTLTLDVQKENAVIITADNEKEYRSKMNEIKKRFGDNYIESKQVVGVIIPVSTEYFP